MRHYDPMLDGSASRMEVLSPGGASAQGEIGNTRHVAATRTGRFRRLAGRAYGTPNAASRESGRRSTSSTRALIDTSRMNAGKMVSRQSARRACRRSRDRTRRAGAAPSQHRRCEHPPQAPVTRRSAARRPRRQRNQQPRRRAAAEKAQALHLGQAAPRLRQVEVERLPVGCQQDQDPDGERLQQRRPAGPAPRAATPSHRPAP